MVLNENIIRKIVSESLSSLLLELSIGQVGRSGPIKESDMIVPSQVFGKEYEISKQIYEKHKQNPRYHANIEKIFGDTNAYKVYKNYYNAMMSKEGKQAVGFITWLHFLCNGKKGQPIMGYEVDGSYLFGLWINGFFLCAYFAPTGYKGMLKVISGIAQYNNIIFAVTQDMSSMLERLGIPKADKTHDAPWRDKIVTKDVFGTSQAAIENGFKILDRGVEMQNVKDELRKGLKKGDEEVVKELVAQYKKLNDTQKEEFKGKLSSMLKQKYPELFEKYKEQWHLK